MTVREMLRCYFVAGSQDFKGESNRPQALLECLEQALKCGLTCYQFREKGAGALQNKEEIKALAQATQALCQRYNVPFFVDDDLELALSLNADGIHVGQSDMPIAQLIARVQGRMLIGLSTHSIEQFRAANALQGVDYCGFGPIFPTQSKPDAEPAVGIDAIRAVRAAGLDKPMVAIGGISAQDARAIRQAGADGVAVISAIAQSRDVGATLAQLLAN